MGKKSSNQLIALNCLFSLMVFTAIPAKAEPSSGDILLVGNGGGGGSGSAANSAGGGGAGGGIVAGNAGGSGSSLSSGSGGKSVTGSGESGSNGIGGSSSGRGGDGLKSTFGKNEVTLTGNQKWTNIGVGGSGGSGGGGGHDAGMSVGHGAGKNGKNGAEGGQGGGSASAITGNQNSEKGGNGGNGQDGNLTFEDANVTSTLVHVGGDSGKRGEKGQIGFGGYAGSGGDGTLTLDHTVLSTKKIVIGGKPDVNALGGKGILNLQKGSTINVSSTAGDSFQINDTGTLNIGGKTANANTGGNIVGTGTLINDGKVNFNQTDTAKISLKIEGNGEVNINGKGFSILSGENTYTGTTNIAKGATLQLGEGGATGSVASDISNNGSLIINRNNEFKHDKVISGSGSLEQKGTGTTVLGGKNTYKGGTTITNGKLVANNANALGTGVINNKAELEYNITSGDLNLANKLIGDGKVTIKNGGQFNIKGNSTEFTGNLILADKTQFLLDQNNSTKAQGNLANATLTAGKDGVVKLGSGTQTIGGLAFDGGTVHFEVSPGINKATNTIDAGTLDLSGSGNVALTVNPYETNPEPTADSGLNLLEQDESNLQTQLATGQEIIGSSVNLTLVDKDGNKITKASKNDINQNGHKVAEATYDYRLTSNKDEETGSGDLSVNYGLTELGLIGKGDNALVLKQEEGATGNAADMSAKLTGSGDLAINAGAGVISLSNTENSYTGATTINTGSLRLDADNALGKTTALTLAENTGLQLNGHTQTINGSLVGDKTSTIDLQDGVLTINADSSLNSSLIGEGALNLNKGTFDISNANTGLSATTTIGKDGKATVNLNDLQGLGSGLINLQNGSNLSLNATGALQNSLTGTGVAQVKGSSVILAGDNTGFDEDSKFEVDGTSQLTALNETSLGSATVNLAEGGQLNLDAAQDWDLTNTISGKGELNKTGKGQVTVKSEVELDKLAVNQGILLIDDDASVTVNKTTHVGKSGSLIGANGSNFKGNMANEGNLYLGKESSDEATNFTMTGDLNNTGNVYVSNWNNVNTIGSTLTVNGNLDGNGNYYLQTNMAEGKGDQINIKGAVTGQNKMFIKDSGLDPTSSDKLTVATSGVAGDGDFTLNGGLVDIGTYRYGLEKEGGSDDDTRAGSGNKWTLVNKGAALGKFGLSKGANASVGIHGAVASLWEEELGSLMNRMGDLRLNANSEGGVWVRQLSHEINATPSSSRSYQQQFNGTQIGADKAFDFDGGKFYLGAMIGNSRSTLDFKEGTDGSIKSQSYGIYGTALFDNGFYLDTLVKYGHMKNQMNYKSNSGAKIKGDYSTDAFGVSVEGGKRFTFNRTWFVEPQLQLTASRLQGSSYKFNNGLNAKSHSMQLFNGRVGIMAGATYSFNNVVAEPYINFSHTQEFSNEGKVTINGNRLTSDQIGTRNHYGVGLNLNIAKQHNVFIDASYEKGNKMEQPWGLKAGYQFRF